VTPVQVVLSDCSAQDAGRLFSALCERFASDREAGEEPHESHRERPTMWTGTFDLPDEPTDPSAAHVLHPVPLSGPVTADLQGTPLGVRHLREVLDESFSVRVLGTIAGDQEVEVQLRLQGRRSAPNAPGR
jgi:hypothetical protein